MTHRFFFAACSLLSGLTCAAAIAVARPAEIPSPVEKIFVPSGFDDNDNVEVILHGEYTDSCHQGGRSGAEVDEATKTITVWATSYRYPSVACAQVLTPFLQVVKVGVLPEGDYQVVYRTDPSIASDLHVRIRTTEAPEDHLYAAVENAQIAVDPETGKQSLKLQGHQPYMFIGCMVVREVRMELDPEDILVVMPISEIIDNEECDEQPADKSFEIQQSIEEPFTNEGLIHVRVLNGDSINRFVPAEPS